MKTTNNNTKTLVFFLGIDVGKTDLYCHLIGQLEAISQRFDNTVKGIKELIRWLKTHTRTKSFAVCLEQTGHYGDAIAETLHKIQPNHTYLVNPQRIKAFGMQKLRRNKSDTADAKLIARFLQSEHTDLRPWQPKTIEEQRITALNRYAETLTQNNATHKTLLHSQTDKTVRSSIQRQIKTTEKELAIVRAEIDKLIKSTHTLKAKFKLLRTIPGIGKIAAHTLIAELPDIQTFADARQLAAWSGLTPRHSISGTSGKNRTPITKIGSTRLRRGLFMPAMTARVFNPSLKAFADRLKNNGKIPKQIIVAVMRKLLHQIYGILKSGKVYDPNKRGFHPPSITSLQTT